MLRSICSSNEAKAACCKAQYNYAIIGRHLVWLIEVGPHAVVSQVSPGAQNKKSQIGDLARVFAGKRNLFRSSAKSATQFQVNCARS